MFDVIARELVFPGARVRLLPDEVEATLAPGERLIVTGGNGPDAITGIVRPPASGQGWIAFFYGNAMTLGVTRPIRDQLCRDGNGVVCVDYPGFGLSGGQPSEAGCYRAADAALAMIAQAGGRAATTSVVGWSLGSAVAVDLAARSDVRRLVLVSPMSSLAAVGCALLLRAWAPQFDIGPFNAVHRAPGVRAPTLLIAGETDTLTPPPLAAAIRDRIGGPARLEIIPGANHNDLLATAAAWTLIRAFLHHHEEFQR